jgi:hypothetical protein
MSAYTLTKSKQANERDNAITSLRSLLSPGDTVHTIIRSVSSSGISRTMSLYVVKDNRLVNITYYTARALNWTLRDVNGSRVMRVGGCGMDMGFHAVNTLSSVILSDGYALKHEWA